MRSAEFTWLKMKDRTTGREDKKAEETQSVPSAFLS